MPYANGPLHLGHIRSTYLPADIYARYNRLAGNKILYICATDEHGTPIVVNAEKDGKTPAQFVEFYYEKDKKEFAELGFSFDIFHRTSSKENRTLTKEIFSKLSKNNFIYQKQIEQPYCEKCARFLPDRLIIGVCPYCKAEAQYSDLCENCGRALKNNEILQPKCVVCETSPIEKTSIHYFFKLSAFSEQLEQYISKNPRFQKQVVSYCLNWIKGGLTDWDISRDGNWGVPIPNEKNKVFYVWFDAPIGYISSTIAATQDWEKFWKNDRAEIVHFIGKDISYHHYLFWPAMLMGVKEFNIPTAIPVRGHLNLEHKKFSKSRNWFVSIEDFLKEFPADYLRYYETTITPYSVEDANFIWDDFEKCINTELVSNLGNFIHRTLTLIQKLSDSKVPSPFLNKEDEKLLIKITQTKNKTAELIEKFEFRSALEEIMKTTTAFNKYLSDNEPWKNKDKKRVATVLYLSLRWVSALSTLLIPFIPFSAEKLSSILGVKNSSWEKSDEELLKPGVRLAQIEMLFKKIEPKQIKKMKEKLGN